MGAHRRRTDRTVKPTWLGKCCDARIADVDRNPRRPVHEVTHLADCEPRFRTQPDPEPEP